MGIRSLSKRDPLAKQVSTLVHLTKNKRQRKPKKNPVLTENKAFKLQQSTHKFRTTLLHLKKSVSTNNYGISTTQVTMNPQIAKMTQAVSNKRAP